MHPPRIDDPRAQCLGKRVFGSKGEALAAIRAMDKFAKRRKGRKVYKCPHCHSFHIGSA